MIEMVDLMGIRIFKGEEVLASSDLAHVAMREDRAVGIWIPKLSLRHDVVRELVALQTTPFRKFNGVRVETQTVEAYRELKLASMIWGDFQLFTTGLPEIKDFYALAGQYAHSDVLDPTTVGKALDQLKELKEAAERWKQR